MILARETFSERREEVEELLQYLEKSEDPTALTTPGAPKGETLRILRASCYVMIYNMIESTISVCLEDLSTAIQSTVPSVQSLNEKVFERYLISKYNSRLITSSNERAVALARELMDEVGRTSISEFVFVAPSGNCTDKNIENTLNGVGIKLKMEKDLKTRVKRKVSDNRTILEALVRIRNDLAHGNRAFSDVGQGATVVDLKRTFDLAVEYMELVINHFEDYIDNSGYLS
ncbi:MAE_28990/MAE_18760 family HEPN-like nuclease [Rhodococcus pyridinivorans]|uniref:MAE_28990/MAE_18760 family HEPN-like nuclease n=1 Tax=Rhodococcus pyridinivorans TaxID=103816 RepID=UPI002000430A|nr:MAE_28990/MAE_18760 family HEPN-like nuclease [Rhodococcus pyridinivorans]UPK62844.1 MAE_28990/MAE_18760 family HEPN-like nuclease [Rhodococcus pyridinivorans]